MKAFLGLLFALLLLAGVGAALVAFSWSPLNYLIEGEESSLTSTGGGGSGSQGTESGTSSQGAGTSDTSSRASDNEFSGNGSKSLGTLVVDDDSVLSWTNEGESGNLSFAVMDTDFRINVSVQGKRSGQSRVAAGTYQDVTVNAVGPWTMTIEGR